MDRRSFLGLNQEKDVSKALAPRQIHSGLSPYAGSWGKPQASHLLRRSLFGPKASEISWAVNVGLDATLDALFADQNLPEPPLNFYDTADPVVPLGNTWIDAPYVDGSRNSRRRISLLAWSMGLRIHQNISLREKMCLFWHNHFAIQSTDVVDSRFLYKYCNLIREQALGNFNTLAERITVDPAMLHYLNGNSNFRQSDDGGQTFRASNENYGRELLELFTIGKGDDGTEIYYTEDDVRAAARVLTGWIHRGRLSNRFPISVEFRTNRHDPTPKQFSSHFNNRVITDNGADEYKDLIGMIFEQPETARFICRKLYRWFVYYEIDENVESQVIAPMANILRFSNFEIKPALRALLGSEHFFDAVNQGCVIKNPLEFTVGIHRQFEIEFPEYPNILPQYLHWYRLHSETTNQLQEYLNPPDVAGWPAYYQLPRYHTYWISSVTLPARQNTVSLYNKDQGYRSSGFQTLIQPLTLLNEVSDPLDPNVLISEWAELLFPQALEQSQLDFLKEVLIPGLPDYEWTLEYRSYLRDTADQELKASVLSKLRALLDTMMSLAEFHLC